MPIKYNCNYKDLILNIFCIVDDLLKFIKQIGKKAGRKALLSLSEIISINIFGKMLGFKTLKQTYWHIRNYHANDFRMPDYKNSVELANKYANEALRCLLILMNFNVTRQKNHPYFVDATRVAVRGNKRIFHHKVARGFAQRGKSTMGWFYRFKLHLITDCEGNPVRMSITPGNVDDRNPVLPLTKGLKGALVGDAGYVGEPLREKLLERGVKFLTGVRGNMKKLMTEEQHARLKARQIVESSFSVLKGSSELVSSLSRSIHGHFARIIYAVLTYAVGKQTGRAFLRDGCIS